MNFRRSLAKHEIKKNIDNSSLRVKIPDYTNHRGKKKEDILSSYGHLKRAGLNDLDNYIKGYNKRYAKKRGFAKLDCYCEKKIFDRIEYINRFAEKMENNKNSYKKITFNKFLFKVVLFAFSPLLGLIFPLLFGGEVNNKPIIRWCVDKHTDGRNCYLPFVVHAPKEVGYAVTYMNFIIAFIMLTIVIFVIIYAFIKLIKYEKLKNRERYNEGK